MQTFKESSLKIKIVKIGLTGRMLILVSSLYLEKFGGFRPDTLRELMYIIMPLSCMYIVLFIKFIFKAAYRYPVNSPKPGSAYIGAGYYGLLILNVAEFLVIIYKALSSNQLPQLLLPDFFLSLVILESVFGLLAGFYISDLFSDKS